MSLKPSSWPWWAWGLIILGIILIAPSVGLVVLNVLTRGKRLTTSVLDDNGDCETSPQDLAAQASATLNVDAVDVDVYSLARMLASEEESATPATKAALAWVAINVAALRGTTVTLLLTHDVNAHGDGKYGHQAGRWASTATDPYEQDFNIAINCMTGSTPDPTDGAVHFFRPSLQDRLLALGKVKSSAAAIDAEWGGNGFTVPGVDSGITFYRSA
jgi:hypothetical protein